jgi:PAS domain S-box-containing protein
MDWELVYYITSLSITIVVSLGVARYAWRRRSIPGADYFALYMLGALLWALGMLLQVVSTNPILLILGSAVAGIGIVVMPVAWLAFALKYTGRGTWLTTRTWTVITVPPIIAFLLLMGYGIYEAIQQERGLDVAEPGPALIIALLVAGTSVSLLLLTGTLLIIQALTQAPKMYRRQYYSLLVGVWGPWVFGLLALWGQDQFALALLPLAAAMGGLIATWGMFRYQVFDVMPIALDTVIESISDGVIVLDTQDRIVGLNPAAQSMTNLSAEQDAGLPITQALSDWREFLRCLEQEQTQVGITLQEPVRSDTIVTGKDGGYYELRISPLFDRREALSGRLVLLQDISARVQAEEELRRISDERARRNRELALLNRVIAATTSRLEPTAVLKAVCRELTLAFDLPHAAVAMLNDTRTALTVVAESGALADVRPGARTAGSTEPSSERPSGLGAMIPVENNPATQYVLERKEPLAILNAQHDPRMAPVHELMRQLGITSLLILPLIVRDEVAGTIGLDAFEQREFSDEEITLAASATAAAAQALDQAQAEEALRESEETLKLAMEGANVGFFHLTIRSDETVLVRGWSPGRGDEPEESETTLEAWSQMEQVHPDDRAKYSAAFDTHVSGQAPFFEVEFRGLTESGDWTWMVHRGQVVARDEHGQPLRIAGMYQDISARVRAQEELRQARRAAENANRAKSDFLANMSHELRTPLNAILGFAQLMTRDAGLTAEQRENLETIGRSGEHLLGLINDVLELSKIEAGRVALQKECFDLHRLLDGLEEMFHLRAIEKGLMLIFDRAPDVPQYVRTDEGKLRQVLMNILGNAVKFTREGGITLRVGTKDQGTLRETEDQLLSLIFEVEDTGPGIAPEELDAVFDPFTQTASGQKSHEGTGLGMPISRQFVRLMGGDLTLSSELGIGSLFKFDFQVELADAADVPTAQPMRRVIGLEPDQPVYRLLVVEDREANRRLLVKLLAPLGFELREAVTGQEGIEVWQRWKPHLIWMDMRMPIMDGYAAARHIKATTQGQATVIIALTASAFESDRAVILSGGCDDYVRKPFREEEIYDTLTKHLGVRFVYEEGTQPFGVTAETAEGLLTSAALAALPADWVNSLHQAATQLDADLILDLLDQVREQNAPLADAVESLVRDFRFDTIMTCCTKGGR